MKEEIKDNTEICKQKPELCKAGKDTASSKPSIGSKQQGRVILYALFRNTNFDILLSK